MEKISSPLDRGKNVSPLKNLPPPGCKTWKLGNFLIQVSIVASDFSTANIFVYLGHPRSTIFDAELVHYLMNSNNLYYQSIWCALFNKLQQAISIVFDADQAHYLMNINISWAKSSTQSQTDYQRFWNSVQWENDQKWYGIKSISGATRTILS